MPLDDAFQSGTDAVLTDLAQRPRPPVPQAPSFSMWGLMKAAPSGLTAGAAQGAGSTADVLGAFGQVMGAMGDEDWRLPDPAKARKQTQEARERLERQGGPDFNSRLGETFRDVGRSYMPDPVTSHAAEQAVANLFRLGGKAVAAGAVFGPLGGAAVAGAEEGFTTADDLRRQGVDLDTRTQVGLVTALGTGASLAVPVAGQTLRSTVGLALAGGPVAFIGQNAATRKILADADYTQLADQYDPFDPVGLTLSTVLPLGFGALALRGARGGRAGRAENVPPGAAPDAAGTAADAPPAPRIDADAVDAARVAVLRENVEAHRLTPPEDLAGAAAHDTAMTKAMDQLAAGQRVEVSDVAPLASQRAVDALAPRVARAMDEAGQAARVAEPPPTALVPDLAAAPLRAADGAPARAAESGPVRPEAGGAPKLVSESPELDRAVMAIEAERPDLMVHLDDTDGPVPLAELMQRVREELGRDLQESPLIEAAAQCFLRTGG